MGVMTESRNEGQERDEDRIEHERKGAREVHARVDPLLEAWEVWARDLKAKLLKLLIPLLGPQLAAKAVDELMHGRPTS